MPPPREDQLVGLPAVDAPGPERAVLGQHLSGLGLVVEAVARGGVDPPQLERGTCRPQVGQEQARPPRDLHPARRLRHDVGRAGRPTGEELVHDGERLGRRGHLDVALARVAVVLGPDDLAGRVAHPPYRQRGHPARRSGRRTAVDVDVVRHPCRPLGRAGQVSLHNGGPQRVPRQVDLGRTGVVEQAGDPLVERDPHLLHRCEAEERVVLEGADPVGGVPVRREAHGLRLELGGRPREPVHEHDRVVGAVVTVSATGVAAPGPRAPAPGDQHQCERDQQCDPSASHGSPSDVSLRAP